MFVFMLVMTLLIPAIMLGFGKRFSKHAPKNINPLFGYRTTLSMKNEKTWDYAHKLLGKLWTRLGSILFLSPAPLVFVIRASHDTLGLVGSIILYAQITVLILSIIPIEVSLRRKFDKDGNEK